MSLYTGIVRPLLFTLPPETAHDLGKWWLRRESIWRLLDRRLTVDDDVLRLDLCGLKLTSPVGLAAGFDKNCDTIGSMAHLGFGYLTGGTILWSKRMGNPKPRLIRYPDKLSLGVALGLPSRGVETVVKNLKKLEKKKVPIIGNVEGFSTEEYVRCYQAVEPYVDAMEISTKCPAVEKDKDKDPLDPAVFRRLLGELLKVKKKPLFVKIPRYSTEKERENRLELVDICLKNGVEGLTLNPRKIVKEPRISIGSCDLTGKPIFEDMVSYVNDIYNVTGGKISIKALGGVFTGDDAFRAIRAGATTIELVSALVYKGWAVVREINLKLAKLLRENNYSSVGEARGAKTP